MVASTLLAAAGCLLILFTTGRGTPFGSAAPPETSPRALQKNFPGVYYCRGGFLRREAVHAGTLRNT